ncbi:GerAB/ArcD/ProY family transporter [Alicyclobacillus fastidiosus]|uniref:Endospore germination permease n=3 Tax=Alicyclobacillus fastidiosus TaxID=392011 RepID=A0ABY6ZQ05_9BACL|nr:endospore germination permease [Alicyclobacillus fastidiosus]WAH44927.1 endospore germination permease [Alicyclobacillus fastidiosus]WEH10055.1 endospore germination permease [Alicyclobacillus fastidiosus]
MAQTTMILMLAIGLNDHVILIPLLLRAAGRDAWLAVCLTSLLVFVAMMFMQYVIRASKQQHIGLWLREQIPPLLANGLLCLMALPLFVAALVTFRDTVFWAKITLLPVTPNFVLVLVLAALCFYCAYAGIASIAIASGILLPFVVVFGFFVGTSNIPHKDMSLLFPLLEHGWNPVFRGILYSASGFSELFMILCMQHYIKSEVRYWMLALNVLILLVLTLGPLYGAIVEFGPKEATSMRFPAFEEWRLITFGHFFEHLDFLGIYQWLSGAFVRISFTAFLIVEIFGMRKGRGRTWFLGLLFGTLCVFAIVRISDTQFLGLLQRVVAPGYLYCVTAIALLLVIIAWKSKRRKVHTR